MPSYLSYLNQISVLDADDDIQWITVRGDHIPIKKGENKEDAIKSFFESKGKESKKTEQKSPEKSGNSSSSSGNGSKSEKSSGGEKLTVKSIIKRANESKNNKSINSDYVFKEAVKVGKFSDKQIRDREKDYSDYLKKDVKQTFEVHTTDHIIENGELVGYKYKPERIKIQDKILEKTFENWQEKLPAKGEKPRLVILGGRGGSGKSHFTDGSLGEDGYDKRKYVVIDPDEYKTELPEYKKLVDEGSRFGGLNAWEVHEESSDMKKRALDIAMKRGVNVVLDGTLAKYSSAKKTLDKFKDKGYIIDVAFMELPREKSAVRGVNRGMRVNKATGVSSGRWVPVDVMLGMTDCEENFDKLSKDADHWVMYDNDVPEGEKPRFVAKGGKNG